MQALQLDDLNWGQPLQRRRQLKKESLLRQPRYWKLLAGRLIKVRPTLKPTGLEMHWRLSTPCTLDPRVCSQRNVNPECILYVLSLWKDVLFAWFCVHFTHNIEPFRTWHRHKVLFRLLFAFLIFYLVYLDHHPRDGILSAACTHLLCDQSVRQRIDSRWREYLPYENIYAWRNHGMHKNFRGNLLRFLHFQAWKWNCSP